MNKKYFKYLFKANANMLIFMAILNFAIVTLDFLFEKGPHDYNGSTVGVLLVVECMVLPLYLLRFLFSKSGADVYFGLPLKRREVVFTNLLFIFTIIFSANIIFFLLPYSIKEGFDALILFLAVLIAFIIICLLSIFTAIILKFNNISDAIIGLIAYCVLPIMFWISAINFLGSVIIGYNVSYQNFPIEAFMISEIVSDAIGGAIDLFNKGSSYLVYSPYLILLVLFIIGFISLLFDINSRKSEDIGGVSKSIWGYPLIIFVSVILLMLFVIPLDDLTSIVIYFALIFVYYLLMNFIYKRKFKISIAALLAFVLFILASYGVKYLGIMSDGFGLNQSFLSKEKINSFNLSIDLFDDDKGTYYNVSFNETRFIDGNKDEKMLSYVHDLQSELLKEAKNNEKKYPYNDVIVSLSITYDDGGNYNYYVQSFDKEEVIGIYNETKPFVEDKLLNDSASCNGEFIDITAFESSLYENN